MPMSEENAKRFSIGYALAPKKVETVIQPPLVVHAKSRGIDLIPIDTTKPLIEQGPFDCVLHKLYEEEWKHQLTALSVKNPSVAIIDQSDAIERLHNRVSMLEVVDELPLITDSGNGNTLGIPKQVVIYDSETLSDPSTLRDLKFPAIAKPLVANGKDESHIMSLVFNKDGLVGLKPPIVLQEFVNHGGVIFKVYVAGEHVRCVKRRSLPDISEEKLKTLVGMLPFSQISNHAIQDQGNDISKMHIEQAEMPPLNFIHDMANGLRQALKLNLFNFDMIRDVRSENRYLVIDINYFPGYAKVPSYENMLTDFFWDIVNKKQSETTNSELKES